MRKVSQRLQRNQLAALVAMPWQLQFFYHYIH